MKGKQITVPVVVLKTRTGYNAFSPIIDGCAATAKTVDTALKRIKAALEFHLEGQMLVKQHRKTPQAILKDTFDDYGTEAVYAAVTVASADH